MARLAVKTSRWLLLAALLMLMSMLLPCWAEKQQSSNSKESSSTSATEDSSNSKTTEATETANTTDGNQRKSVRVEHFNETDAESSGTGAVDQNYDVIDVLAATSAVVGKSKSGQTTRIYTTGEVNEDFWLKHLGDDFKHAIHLQVGGTNDDYNHLLNQTSNGVHEEIHHEYLPGAERPGDPAPKLPGNGVYAADGRAATRQVTMPLHEGEDEVEGTGNGIMRNFQQRSIVSHLSLDDAGLLLKHKQFQQQKLQRRHGSKPSRYNTQGAKARNTYTRTPQHTHQPTHTHTQSEQHEHTHTHARGRSQKGAAAPSSVINSSEDTLHTAASSTSAAGSSSKAAGLAADADMGSESYDSQLPFKSPFNDYGTRPTRDLTHEFYQRGL